MEFWGALKGLPFNCFEIYRIKIASRSHQDRIKIASSSHQARIKIASRVLQLQQSGVHECRYCTAKQKSG